MTTRIFRYVLFKYMRNITLGRPKIGVFLFNRQIRYGISVISKIGRSYLLTSLLKKIIGIPIYEQGYKSYERKYSFSGDNQDHKLYSLEVQYAYLTFPSVLYIFRYATKKHNDFMCILLSVITFHYAVTNYYTQVVHL